MPSEQCTQPGAQLQPQVLPKRLTVDELPVQRLEMNVDIYVTHSIPETF